MTWFLYCLLFVGCVSSLVGCLAILAAAARLHTEAAATMASIVILSRSINESVLAAQALVSSADNCQLEHMRRMNSLIERASSAATRFSTGARH